MCLTVSGSENWSPGGPAPALRGHRLSASPRHRTAPARRAGGRRCSRVRVVQGPPESRAANAATRRRRQRQAIRAPCPMTRMPGRPRRAGGPTVCGGRRRSSTVERTRCRAVGTGDGVVWHQGNEAMVRAGQDGCQATVCGLGDQRRRRQGCCCRRRP